MRQLQVNTLLLLLLPHALSGFVAPSTPRHSLAIIPSRHVDTRKLGTCLHRRDAKSTDLVALGATSATLIEQFTDPLLLQHVATGGALAFAGDVIAQSLLSESEEKSFPPADWDVVRTQAFVAFGALYTGGVQHFLFAWLNVTFEDPVVRLLLNQFIFISFCYYPVFLAIVPFLRAGWEAEEGFGSDEAKERQKELFTEVAGKIPSTLLRNWGFWLPVQFVQFNYIPVDFHVTFTAAFGLVWNAILSWSTATSSMEPSTATSGGKK